MALLSLHEPNDKRHKRNFYTRGSMVCYETQIIEPRRLVEPRHPRQSNGASSSYYSALSMSDDAMPSWFLARNAEAAQQSLVHDMRHNHQVHRYTEARCPHHSAEHHHQPHADDPESYRAVRETHYDVRKRKDKKGRDELVLVRRQEFSVKKDGSKKGFRKVEWVRGWMLR
jgi:hypothetical protein